MKRIVVLTLSLVLSSGAAVRAAPQAQEGALPRMKTRLIEYIDARIKILEQARHCVEKAASLAAATACHERERSQTKALRRQARQSR